ncbi:alpha/beta fold hydrolase [Bacillus sp. FJAT-45350]|uniref:alpha/beta fold hydrolase n=1 Tax=Bacillus sp. FJAT-45350 TaxID=2011014 RepID=UPI000BB714D2|nr:alpha/beta hydrolase [Bacillus sp. FJAT-45350]
MAYAKGVIDTPIYYESTGKGTPIVFIHPPGMGHVTFKKQQSLADDFQVITYDMRGNGRSGNRTGTITMSMQAEDIIAVLDDLHVDRAVICGYSNGGSIAQEFAISYPDRTLGVILCGGFSEVNSLLLRNEFRLGIWAASNKLMSLFSNVLSKAHCKTKEFQQELADYILRTNPQVLEKMYEEGLHYKSTDRLNEINVPLLLAYGELEFYTHHYQYPFRNSINDVEVVYISKATHQLPTKNYQELNRIITGFIKRKIEKRL